MIAPDYQSLATELATNMIRYAAGGEMLIGAPGDTSRKGVELIAVPGWLTLRVA